MAPQNKVIIVGGGLAGTMLACLLEKSGTPYEILERGDTVTFLGTAITLSAGALAVIEQLGLLNEFNKISKPMKAINVHTCDGDKVNLLGSLDYSQYLEKSGFAWCTAGRKELHSLLMSQLPKNKMQLNKKVIDIQETDQEVTVHCEDGSFFTGTIVCGADGVRSTVRTFMQKDLKSKNKLTRHDAGVGRIDCVAVIGITQGLSKEKFLDLKSEYCLFDSVMKTDTEYAWTSFTTPGDRYSWFIWRSVKHASPSERQALIDKPYKELIAEYCAAGREFPMSFGSKLGDLMDNTREQDMTKVVIEEIVYDSWHSGRLVLIGDACHKTHPAAGLNANHAIMDAVELSSQIHELDTVSTPEEIARAFEAYYKLRYPIAKECFLESGLFGSLVLCKTLFDRLPLRFITKVLPTVGYQMVCDRLVQSRPQVTFLERVPDRGTVKPLAQLPMSTKKTGYGRKVVALEEAAREE